MFRLDEPGTLWVPRKLPRGPVCVWFWFSDRVSLLALTVLKCTTVQAGLEPKELDLPLPPHPTFVGKF